jgi:MoxR-like ATPase
MSDSETQPLPENDLASVERLKSSYDRLTAEMGKIIVGQNDVLEQLLISIFAKGHALLIGVPGLAKTLMIQTLSEALDLSFRRVQFTPDLMPSDITGTEVLQEDKLTGARAFKFLPGPLFANLVLADEINRTPPKTQAALLEAMQERQVTVGGTRHVLPEPFFVLATQNPIEQEGTYPLPEAQLDRFMLNILVDYPPEEEELAIVRLTTSADKPKINKVISGPEILDLQKIVRRVPVAEHVYSYGVRLARATRPAANPMDEFLKNYVTWGAGVRASQFLILAARVRAVLQGRVHVGIEDVRSVAYPVLRHRIVTNFNAEAEGMTSDDVIARVLKNVPVDGRTSDNGVPKIFKAASSN